MASVSFGLNRGFESQPDTVLVGTLAVSSRDVELRWDNTVGLQRREIIEILEVFIRRLEDGRFNDAINV
jgi:hypothetical protein